MQKLSSSIYSNLVTNKSWAIAREKMGYSKILNNWDSISVDLKKTVLSLAIIEIIDKGAINVVSKINVTVILF